MTVEQPVKAKRGSVKGGVKLVVGVAVVAGLYGYAAGRRGGYDLGLKDGYIAASRELIDAMREMRSEIFESVGE